MRLRVQAPTQLVFIISLVLAVIGILAAVTTVIVLPIAPFWWVAVAYVILALGCTIRGL
ncbi:hypothetical protein [Breoghania sp. L-A4]|uniref:hypothetical protein n=1 Tax=Breoghania sp. L-A4 TaxID=2304600 RepID=UPI0013C342B3|nr:hypothetical protein [Breoghania sp. L-A4]